MIAFEGFELKNSEDSIIHRQPSTQPMVLDTLMKAFGAKEGSSWSEDVSFLSPEQQEGLKSSLSGLKDLKYKGPGGYTSGQAADDLEGFRGSSVDSLKKLQDEGRLSVSGIEKLRNMMAGASGQVMPDVEALRGIGDKAWAGYDAQLAETTRGAREKLQEADIASRRGPGAFGGTALSRLGSRNVMEYGRTVGSAAARAVEESSFRRQQLAMQARVSAGQLGLGIGKLGLEGLQTAGQLELGELGLTAQDLAQRRALSSQEKIFGAQHGLDIAKFSEEQAQAKNLWSQRNSEFENQFGLNRLQTLGDLSSRRTQERIEHVKKGSAGMLPGLVGAAMTIWGGPAGAAAAGPVMGALQSGYGDERRGNSQGGIYQAAAMYGALKANQPNVQPTGSPYNAVGGTVPANAEQQYSWWQDDPNSGWFDTGAYKDWGFGGGTSNVSPDSFSTSANINTPTRGRQYGRPMPAMGTDYGTRGYGSRNPTSYGASSPNYSNWDRMKRNYNTRDLNFDAPWSTAFDWYQPDSDWF